MNENDFTFSKISNVRKNIQVQLQRQINKIIQRQILFSLKINQEADIFGREENLLNNFTVELIRLQSKLPLKCLLEN